jgi:hypothetical protein
METARPDILKNIEIVRSELISSEFKANTKPPPGSSGHVMYSLQIRPDYTNSATSGKPEQFKQYADVILQAYIGDPQKEPETAKELVCCKISIAVYYKIEKPDYSAEDYGQYQWFFQSWVSLLARSYIRDLLKDTDFSSIPVPFDA